MKCKKARKLLTAYVDGEMAEEDRRIVSEHLVVCDQCRACLAEVNTVLDWAGVWEDRQPSPEFLASLKARVSAAAGPAEASLPFWSPGARKVLAGAVVACLVFAFGYFVGVGLTGRTGAPKRTASEQRQPREPLRAASDLPEGDPERLLLGLQRIKMVFGDKLNEQAFAQLSEVQLALAGAGAEAEKNLAVVRALQEAEGKLRERRFAEAHQLLASLEENHPQHALAPYARMTRMLSAPQPAGYGSQFLDRLYAALLQDTVVDPAQFYNQFATVQAEVTEFGWQKIVESAGRFNPVNLLDYIENRLANGDDL
jgi:hypothetical protein